MTYSDFDEEDLDILLAAALVYHPLLDTSGDLAVPEPGEFVRRIRHGLDV